MSKDKAMNEKNKAKELVEFKHFMKTKAYTTNKEIRIVCDWVDNYLEFITIKK